MRAGPSYIWLNRKILRLTLGKITAAAKELPVEFSIDQLMDELILLEKMEEALSQAERSETYTTEEARQLLKQ